LTHWYLLSNVDQDVDASTIALWYYYRWRIESYSKLLKSGGQEIEHRQQESGLAILKRLLVVSMACSVVWSLQRDESGEATELKQTLVRLSGKSQKRRKPPTARTLLSGLFVLMMILGFLDSINYDLTQIDNLRTRLANFAEIFL
jgi:ABC-type nickel/cobalt efflux system permease component RcnA